MEQERLTLDHDTLRELSAPSNLRGALDLLLVWGAIAGIVAAAVHLDQWWAYALAVVLIGSRQNALATLAHEAWHGSTFSSRRVNHWIGAWCYSYPIAIPYEHDRRRHMRHHREVGHDHDPDWINYASAGRETPWRVVRYLLGLLCGAMLWGTAWRLLVSRKPRIAIEDTDDQRMVEEAKAKDAPSALGEYLCAALCQAVLVAVLTLTVGWWGYLVFWALPLATFAGFFANFRALIEHVVPDDAEEPDARLRDIAVGPIEALLVSPSHFNFHALHHAFPSVPHYRLTRAKKALTERLGQYPFEVWPGYVRALLAHLRALRKRARERSSTPAS